MHSRTRAARNNGTVKSELARPLPMTLPAAMEHFTVLEGGPAPTELEALSVTEHWIAGTRGTPFDDPRIDERTGRPPPGWSGDAAMPAKPHRTMIRSTFGIVQ